jgi:hypothetical protein
VVDVRKDLTADGLIEEVGRFSRTRVQPGGRRNRTLLGCTTCWGTSGGGWRIGTRTSTPAEANAIRAVSCVARRFLERQSVVRARVVPFQDRTGGR